MPPRSTRVRQVSFYHTLLWKAVYNSDPSALSTRPRLNAEVESALDAAHAFLHIKRPLPLHFSELAWWCHLLMTTISLSNLPPHQHCSPISNSYPNPVRSTEQRVARWLSMQSQHKNSHTVWLPAVSVNHWKWTSGAYQSLKILADNASLHVCG